MADLDTALPLPLGRECTICGEWKPFSEFNRRKNGLHGYRASCKPCTNAQLLARKKLVGRSTVYDKNYMRAWHLKRKFGMSVEDWGALLRAQGERCAICRTPDPGPKDWNVDHDHETGRVRGLLCNNCNTGIGMLCDDPEILRAAVRYLEQS